VLDHVEAARSRVELVAQRVLAHIETTCGHEVSLDLPRHRRSPKHIERRVLRGQRDLVDEVRLTDEVKVHEADATLPHRDDRTFVLRVDPARERARQRQRVDHARRRRIERVEGHHPLMCDRRFVGAVDLVASDDHPIDTPFEVRLDPERGPSDRHLRDDSIVVSVAVLVDEAQQILLVPVGVA
jgi:hypothetical protein